MIPARRSINQLYYRSPADCDEDIMAAVVYLRENKVLRFCLPKPTLGDKLPDFTLTSFPSREPVSLHSIIAATPTELTVIGAFSSS